MKKLLLLTLVLGLVKAAFTQVQAPDVIEQVLLLNENDLIRAIDWEAEIEDVKLLESTRSNVNFISQSTSQEGIHELVYQLVFDDSGLSFAEIMYFFDEHSLIYFSAQIFPGSLEIYEECYEMFKNEIEGLYGSQIAEEEGWEFYESTHDKYRFEVAMHPNAESQESYLELHFRYAGYKEN